MFRDSDWPLDRTLKARPTNDDELEAAERPKKKFKYDIAWPTEHKAKFEGAMLEYPIPHDKKVDLHWLTDERAKPF